jgi:hypothetical protein
MRQTISFGSGKAICRAKVVLAVLLVLCLLRLLLGMLRWPLVGDASLMHYVAFLIDNGKIPYRDIRDINMPGAYFVDWAVMHLLGMGPLAWHVFDALLTVSTFFAGILIALPYDWFAGVFACALFGMIHARDGITQSGQRDFSIAVAALFSYALMFFALRSGKRWPVFFSGLFIGFAVLVKPVAIPLAVCILFLSLMELHRRRQFAYVYPLLWCGGFVAPIAFLAAMLLKCHDFAAFLDVLRGPVLYHASLARLPYGTLFKRIASSILPLICGSVCVLVPDLKLFRNWEYSALFGGSVAGAFCYLIQGKGYSYHRYPFEIFVLLLMGLILSSALDERGWRQTAAGATFLYGCLVLAPVSMAKGLRFEGSPDEFGTLLTHDLESLGGQSLNRKVQCLDTFSGCIRVLYKMRLIESTSLIYDEFIFGPEKHGIIAASRERFWDQVQSDPPMVFIETEQVYPDGPSSFNKIYSWPQLADYVQQNYRIYVERHPAQTQNWEAQPCLPFGYRIYVRK